LTEVDGMVVGHVRVHRVLQFPKLTQIQQDSTKKSVKNCANLWLKKNTLKKVNRSTSQQVNE
ncbi:MAG: hypothetical protein SPF86_05385, partial [Sodaliphilus sp.]|nr:hypothetical protein [Bacteroidales bacterium]MDY5538679.1 hypothetical protein [Sodaliphilus sp.]